MNPRDPFGSNGFQDRRFQPLTHSSVSKYNSQPLLRDATADAFRVDVAPLLRNDLCPCLTFQNTSRHPKQIEMSIINRGLAGVGRLAHILN